MSVLTKSKYVVLMYSYMSQLYYDSVISISIPQLKMEQPHRCQEHYVFYSGCLFLSFHIDIFKYSTPAFLQCVVTFLIKVKEYRCHNVYYADFYFLHVSSSQQKNLHINRKPQVYYYGYFLVSMISIFKLFQQLFCTLHKNHICHIFLDKFQHNRQTTGFERNKV